MRCIHKAAAAASLVLLPTGAYGTTNAVALADVTYPFGVSLASIDGLTSIVDSVVANLTALATNLFTNGELQFYGLSPPVYPAPEAAGQGDWEPAFQKAKTLVQQMTLQEKANITLGVLSTQGCSGFTGSVPRLGFPGICLNDAESGVRGGNLVSGYPSQIHVGASWNRTLANARGSALGREFAGKGINVALGPVIGPIGRVAKGGRNWEGFSNDPYLAGSLAAPTISGLQENPVLVNILPALAQQSLSSNLDDKTMHELYLWPFYDALQAEVGSVMASYQRTNNSYSSQNSKILNGLLKTELGFEGFVVSDWGAVHTGIASNNAGLDMVMPSSQYESPSLLETAVNNGSLPEARLNDQAIRILAAWYRFAEFEDPGMDARSSVDVRTSEAEAINFQSAVEGHVLVKNVDNALPLRKPAALNLFGYDGVGGKNTSAQGPILYLIGLANTQHYSDGRPFTPLDAGLFSLELESGNSMPAQALDGTLLGGGGSGAITPANSFAPVDGFAEQASLDNTTLYTDFTSQSPKVTAPNDPCIVFINAQSAETEDRDTLADSYSDALVNNVASQCNNTIVVIHNAGIRLVNGFAGNPNVTAVIYGHTPGQESGRALVEIMYGKQSPSGRLPYTVAVQESDYGMLLDPVVSKDMYPQSNFNEGLFIDYKYFIAQNITPQYPFGFGLTYSSFNYSNLQISLDSGADTSALPPDLAATPVPQGGLASLYDTIATVTATITNAGTATAAETAQLYVGVPGSGLPKVLRGFDKQLLQPSQSTTYSFPLRRRDLSEWDVVQQQWVLGSGDYTIMVGRNVLDIDLQGTLTIP